MPKALEHCPIHTDGPHPDGPHPDGPHPDGPHPEGPGPAIEAFFEYLTPFMTNWQAIYGNPPQLAGANIAVLIKKK